MRRTSARRGSRAAAAAILVAGLPIVAVVAGAPPAAAAAPPAPGRLAYVGEHHDELAYAIDGQQTPLFPTENGPTEVDSDASADPNGGLVWVSSRANANGAGADRKGDIFYLAPGTDSPVRLAANAAADRQPVLSPDGSTVAFVSDRGGATQIWIVGVDGTGLRQVTTAPAGTPRPADTSPTWSPDGTSLAFTSTRVNGSGEIFTVTVSPAQANPVRITFSGVSGGAIQPAWDPVVDHNRIAFTRTSLLNPARTSVVSIAPNGTGTATNLVPNWDASQASWNADGTAIAFHSRRLNPEGGVYVKSVDDIGGGSPEPELVYDDNRNPEGNPTWFYAPEQPPLIVFTHVAVDELGEIRDIQATDGTGDRSLSFRHGKFENAPTYSPDGRKVAYSRRNGTVTDIVTINADATTVNPTVLTRPRAPEKDVDPVYSPDGSRLAFVRNNRVIVINATTGAELLRVPPPPPTTPNNGFLDGEPTWSADGSRIMFARYVVPPASPPVPQLKALAAHPLDGLDTDIWSARASDGGDQVNITGADDTPTVQFDRQPRLAPSGQALLVNRNNALRLWPLTGNLPSGPATDVVIPFPAGDPVTGLQYPAFAPDSRSIAFSAIHGPSQQRDIGVVTLPLPAGTPTFKWLTTSVGNENQPVWQPASDLEIAVTASDADIVVGETTELTVTVTNLGLANARKVRGALTLQTGLAPLSITPTTIGAVCSFATLSCELPGPLAAEGTLVFTVVASGQQTGTYTPTATVTGTILDLGTANNTAQTTVVVTFPDVEFRDVGVAMATTPTGFKGGDPVVATYTVTNRGQAPATGVTLATDLPTRTLALGTVTGCVLTGASCEIGPLAPGASRKVTVALSPSAKITTPVAGQVTARFGQAGADQNAANDRATSTLKVLEPTLTVAPAVGPPGSVARVVGKDFPPGVSINLDWQSGINPASRVTVVRPDGSFEAQALVFRRDQLGPRFLSASGLRFGAVRDDFLVVQRTAVPPDFVARG